MDPTHEPRAASASDLVAPAATGFLLAEILREANGAPRALRVLEVSAGFNALIGQPIASGAEITSHPDSGRPEWIETAARVAAERRAARLIFQPRGATSPLTLHFTPAAEPGSSLIIVLATARAETRRTESEERKAFLLQLTDTLRPLADPAEIQLKAAYLLGRHLKASRVGYAEDQSDSETIVVTHNYTDGVPGIEGRYRYDDYGPELLREFRAGRTVVRSDIANDPSLTPAEKHAHVVLQLGATVNVPLVKAGRLVAVLFLHYREAHKFSANELALLDEVAERTWAAVERARAEAALLQSEARLRLSLVASGMGTFTWHVADDRGEPDDKTRELLGLQREGFTTLASAMRELVHPDDRERYAAAIARALDPTGDGMLRDEIRIRRPGDDADRWIAVVGQTTFEGAPSRAARIHGMVADITERRNSERALRESEEQLRQFSEASSDILWIRDAKTLRREYVNAAFERVFGVPADAPQAGDSLAQLLDVVLPEDRPHVLHHLDRVRSGERVSFEFRIRRPVDGVVRWIRNTDFPLRDDDGRVRRIAGIGHDITERKAMEDALRTTAERKSEFVAMLGHELRNPLAAIQGGVKLLRSDRSKPESKAAALPILASQVNHMQRLIDDLLDLARIEHGKLQVRPERIDLLETIDRALEMVADPATTRSCEIRLTRLATTVPLHADAVRLTQVWVNLLTNALKFSSAGSVIDVVVGRDATAAFVRVRDYGAGIPADALAEIFQPFAQPRRGPGLPEGGLGLGLTICRQLVEMHHGSLEAFSAGANTGSEFVVRLPLQFPAA